jgi:hypothetical protein
MSFANGFQILKTQILRCTNYQFGPVSSGATRSDVEVDPEAEFLMIFS